MSENKLDTFIDNMCMIANSEGISEDIINIAEKGQQTHTENITIPDYLDMYGISEFKFSDSYLSTTCSTAFRNI
jgi:hypothetical protein